MEHAFNPSSQDEEACEFKANLIYTANFRKAIDSGLKKKKKAFHPTEPLCRTAACWHKPQEKGKRMFNFSSLVLAFVFTSPVF